MKRKLLAFLLALVLVLVCFPAVAFAGGYTYNDNDFGKLQAFLNLPSATAGLTNGQCLNPAYNANDPDTWTDVVWDYNSPSRVVSIGQSNAWQYKALAGVLNLSGFLSLNYLNCAGNGSLSSLDVSGDTNLETVTCFDCGLHSLDVSDAGNSLSLLSCSGNPIGTLDIGANTMLASLQCQNCGLSALDVSKQSNLYYLDCSKNQLSALDMSCNARLQYLFCNGNQLTVLDLSLNTLLNTVDTTSNLLTSLKAKIAVAYMTTKAITLTANAGGYVALFGSTDEAIMNAMAEPLAGKAFLNWMAGSSAVSTDKAYPLTGGADIDLAANFVDELVLAPSQTGGIYTGGRITITPNIPGGVWDYPHDMLSGDFSGAGAMFTGLKAGTAHVTYTADGQTVAYDIVITMSELPSTGQDFTPALVVLALGALTGALAIAMLMRKRRRNLER